MLEDQELQVTAKMDLGLWQAQVHLGRHVEPVRLQYLFLPLEGRLSEFHQASRQRSHVADMACFLQSSSQST